MPILSSATDSATPIRGFLLLIDDNVATNEQMNTIRKPEQANVPHKQIHPFVAGSWASFGAKYQEILLLHKSFEWLVQSSEKTKSQLIGELQSISTTNGWSTLGGQVYSLALPASSVPWNCGRPVIRYPVSTNTTAASISSYDFTRGHR